MTTPFGKLRVSKLIKACAEADVTGVISALGKCSSEAETENTLLERDSWAGSTALHWAAYAGSAPIVTALLAAKANPATTNTRDSALPLHLAARYNKTTDVIEVLASAAPHLVNSANTRGNTPLHETAYEG